MQNKLWRKIDQGSGVGSIGGMQFLTDVLEMKGTRKVTLRRGLMEVGSEWETPAKRVSWAEGSAHGKA